MYLRALFARKPRLNPAKGLPRYQAHWDGVRIGGERLRAYNKVCGYKSLDQVPLLYPHIASSPLQMALISDPTFPIRLVGAIHQRNHVQQYRPLHENETLNIACRIGENRIVKQGMEFDVLTVASTNGERVWESISTYLARGKFSNPVEPPPIANMPEMETAGEEVSWQVASNMGRRYARVSGDYNLIHLSSIIAKVFGFPRSFIHGMWSASACLAHLPRIPEAFPLRYDIAFKGPVFLGSKVTMKVAGDKTRSRFDLYCQNNPRPCIKGMIYTQEHPQPLF
jgi:acyl dehydratase